jgi:hypothetical protein
MRNRRDLNIMIDEAYEAPKFCARMPHPHTFKIRLLHRTKDFHLHTCKQLSIILIMELLLHERAAPTRPRLLSRLAHLDR